jgi:hypothetical protein
MHTQADAPGEPLALGLPPTYYRYHPPEINEFALDFTVARARERRYTPAHCPQSQVSSLSKSCTRSDLTS